MSLPAYNFSSSPDFTVFEFYSIGKKSIKKRIKMEMVDPGEKIYNLSLCTIDENGIEDCENASKNGDMNAIFYTIAYITIFFTDKYPDRKIYFTGSDVLRTRTYQLNIFSSFDLIDKYFIVEGLVIKDDIIIERELYNKGKNYQAFIFIRKTNT